MAKATTDPTRGDPLCPRRQGGGGRLRSTPTKSVLNFLREDLRRTGTKEGCAEGDCGACTVVVGELAGGEVTLKTVNACIQFVPALDGKALFTVEDLRQPNGDLHPVQQAMVDCHGSQCGFCTPGFVMSLVGALCRARGSETTRPTDRAASQRAHRKPLPLHRVSADPRCRPAHVRPAGGAVRPARRCASSSSRLRATNRSPTSTAVAASSRRGRCRNWPSSAPRIRRRRSSPATPTSASG